MDDEEDEIPSTATAPAAPPANPAPPLPAVRRSTRIPVPPGEWWKTDKRNPVHFAYLTEEAAWQDPKWKVAIEKEMANFREYDVWDIVPLPQGRKPIGSKMILTTKANGKLKARGVARGFTQVEGVDFTDTLRQP